MIANTKPEDDDIPHARCGGDWDFLRQFGEHADTCWLCGQVDRELAELESRYARFDASAH